MLHWEELQCDLLSTCTYTCIYLNFSLFFLDFISISMTLHFYPQAKCAFSKIMVLYVIPFGLFTQSWTVSAVHSA